MALLQNVIMRGTHASRPAAGSAGILYFETDSGQLFRDSGSAWQLDDTTLLFTAKGQLLASSASAAVGALAAGTDGFVLTADSTQTLGIKWAAAAGGGITKIAALQGAGSGAADYTTTSTTFVDMDATNLKVAPAAASGDLLLCQATLSAQIPGGNCGFTLNVGGTDVGDTYGLAFVGAPASAQETISFCYLHTVGAGDISAGTVSVKLRYLSGAGTTLSVYNRSAVVRPRVIVANLLH